MAERPYAHVAVVTQDASRPPAGRVAATRQRPEQWEQCQTDPMLLAFVVTLFAGLAVSVGALIVVSGRRLPRAWLAFALAFAAGTMILLSLMDLLPEGIEALEQQHSPPVARLLCLGAFFAGVVLLGLIDRLVPEPVSRCRTRDHRTEICLDLDQAVDNSGRLMRSGLMVALVLALHSIPEGMATFFSTYNEPRVGVGLGVAIALHNVPEGLAVAAPIFSATGSKAKALGWATLAGLAEPLGGVIAAGLIATVIPPDLTGALYGLIAGMMIFLAFDELLPSAWRYQTNQHQAVYGVLAGMGVVALSLILFTI